jgi:competence protein ComEA
MRKSIISILILVALTLGATGAFAAEAAKSPAGVVNINTADASQIAFLPRIGAKTAERVVEFREDHGAFKHATDLMQVKGIGAKTFELLAPYVVVDGKTTLTSKQRVPKAEKPSNQAQK